ncbi:SDR family oxidoreductase [Bernardetia sp. MNP-M8]|uniref:SDR family oxidoreductase n=1 Tax=Bernardetia sp. MNP-M8 TaxID=3127470 RepID=UPI0030D41CFE
MSKTFDNKVVIITGGTSGIGRACAEAFGKEGAKIVITGRNSKKLKEAQDFLENQHIEVLPLQLDVSKESDNKELAEKTVEKFGKIDILINNAGISMRALFKDLDLSVLKSLMDINFWGTVYATKYCIPHIIKTKGSIVGISSIAGFRGLPARTGYSASKFAMQGFLEALRTEMKAENVHVLIACPGYTSSNIRNTALLQDGRAQGDSPKDEGKMMTSEECANHILKATKKRKNILILTLQGKMTVFLNKLFPSFMDKLVLNAIAKEGEIPK